MLQLKATREIIVVKTQETEIQTEYFVLWETSKQFTINILDSKTPLDDYIELVKSESYDEQVPVYYEGDYFDQGPVDYYEEVNVGDEHLAELIEWINYIKHKGYDVGFCCGVNINYAC